MTELTPDIADIVDGCQQGDRCAQRRLYDVERQRVHRLCIRLVGEQDAADLAQQVFLKVFRTIRQFSGRSKFETWLYRLTFNECLQHLRSRRRHPEVELTTEPAVSAAHGNGSVEDSELLQAALDRLEPELKSVFVLREIERMSYTELAETLEVSAGTVASRLNRARTQLRELLTELGWEP